MFCARLARVPRGVQAFSADVNTTLMRSIVKLLIDTGLAQKGYRYVNVDEGWLKDRYPNGSIYEDTKKFPEGMKAFGDWVHAQETAPGSGEYMKYGLYTCESKQPWLDAARSIDSWRGRESSPCARGGRQPAPAVPLMWRKQ